MKHLTKSLLTLITIPILGIGLLFLAGYFGIIDFYQPFVVLSGSMQPAIPTGSVVLVLPKQFGYSVGDVITFSRGRDSVTTHRLVGYDQKEGQLLYRTKGDANSDPDTFTTNPDDVIGRVIGHIPYIGYAAGVAQKPQGFIFLVIVPATVIVYEELKNLRRELTAQITSTWRKLRSKNSPSTPPEPLPPAQPQLAPAPIPAAPAPKTFSFNPAITLPIVGAVLVITGLTASFFSDSEASLGNILGAANNFDPDQENGASTQSLQLPQLFAPITLPTYLATPSATPTATNSATPAP